MNEVRPLGWRWIEKSLLAVGAAVFVAGVVVLGITHWGLAILAGGTTTMMGFVMHNTRRDYDG